MTAATDLITVERHRQINAEGYTPEHDHEHGPALLVDAAVAYAYTLPAIWPWDAATFKAEGLADEAPGFDATVRDLVKAAALLAAAIDTMLAEEA